MTMENIIKQAMDLGSAIAESETMHNLRMTQMRLGEDSEAYQLLLEYQEARMAMENKLAAGQSIAPDDEQALDSLEKNLTANELVKELMKAQEAFDSMMQGVYFAIDEMITGGSCAGGCEGCAGC
ncbi:MAG: YlbF family regulator [Syntrophomonadaceae bacterium]|nr:YlbF family regulator [Syntrophomonadaceae bacterium]